MCITYDPAILLLGVYSTDNSYTSERSNYKDIHSYIDCSGKRTEKIQMLNESM